MNAARRGLKPIGVFGGTFDPVHCGHLRTAFEMLEALDFAQIRFVPCGDPPHRGGTVASAEQRLAMVLAATSGQPGFAVDEREVRRAGPSYSVDTLDALRREFPRHPLGLILGMDAFIKLPSWHRWTDIFDVAHVVVAHRPGWRAPDYGPLGELLAERRTHKVESLHETPAGLVHIHAVTPLDIASTDIRELLRIDRSPRFLVPDPVIDVMRAFGCYEGALACEQ